MAAETLVSPDGENDVRLELDERMPGHGFPGLHVGTMIPKVRPNEFLRVIATGGPERDLVTDDHTIVLEGFAVDQTRAQRMVAFALAALQAAGRDGQIGTATCSLVRVVSLPQNLPMPSVPDRFRFTAMASVTLRRVAV